jgi:hypothetical protein
MGFLQKLSDALKEQILTPIEPTLPAVRNSGQRMATAHAETFRRLEDGPRQETSDIPQMLEARGVEQCYRCGQRAVKEQVIYNYRGMFFGGDCIGRALIIERQQPGISTTLLQEELVRDMKRFRALGMARSARRLMRENS